MQSNIIIYAMKNLNSEYYFLIIGILADFEVQKISLTYLIKLHLYIFLRRVTKFCYINEEMGL